MFLRCEKFERYREASSSLSSSLAQAAAMGVQGDRGTFLRLKDFVLAGILRWVLDCVALEVVALEEHTSSFFTGAAGAQGGNGSSSNYIFRGARSRTHLAVFRRDRAHDLRVGHRNSLHVP